MKQHVLPGLVTHRCFIYVIHGCWCVRASVTLLRSGTGPALMGTLPSVFFVQAKKLLTHLTTSQDDGGRSEKEREK